jgi:predicted CopG family antitoxin
MYIVMATKCITITTGAYERLAGLKEGKDSFSDVINRLTAKGSLLDLVGLLSNKEANTLKTHIKELRDHSRKRMEHIAEMMR